MAFEEDEASNTPSPLSLRASLMSSVKANIPQPSFLILRKSLNSLTTRWYSHPLLILASLAGHWPTFGTTYMADRPGYMSKAPLSPTSKQKMASHREQCSAPLLFNAVMASVVRSIKQEWASQQITDTAIIYYADDIAITCSHAINAHDWPTVCSN